MVTDEIITTKTKELYTRYEGRSSLLDAAIGHYAAIFESFDYIPRVFIRDSEWIIPWKPLARIEGMMRTATFDTVNFKDPDSVDKFAELFHLHPLHDYKDPVEFIKIYEDMSRIIAALAGGPGVLYRDRARYWPGTHKHIRESIDKQTGDRTRLALALRRPLKRLVEGTTRIAQEFSEAHGVAMEQEHQEVMDLHEELKVIGAENLTRILEDDPQDLRREVEIRARLDQLHLEQEIDPRLREYRQKQHVLRGIRLA
jgi:hypothetical protein